MMQPCPLFRPAQYDAGKGVLGPSSCRSIFLANGCPYPGMTMRYRSEVNSLEVLLTRQARIVRIVLIFLVTIALTKVLMLPLW